MNWPWKGSGDDPGKYLDDVYRYARARRFSREDAEDIAMEVVQSFQARGQRRDLRAYMIGICRRKIADRLRSARETVTLVDTDTLHRFDDAANEAALVEQVLSQLTDEQREVLTLRFVIGLNSRETGIALDRSSKAVDSLVQRGRAAFVREWNALSSEEVTL